MNSSTLAIEAKITRLLVNSSLSRAEVMKTLKDVLEVLCQPVPYEIVEDDPRKKSRYKSG